MARAYDLRRYHLTLSSWVGIAIGASHWYCRIRWTDEDGTDQEMDAEHGHGDERTSRFDTKAAARSAPRCHVVRCGVTRQWSRGENNYLCVVCGESLATYVGSTRHPVTQQRCKQRPP